MLTAAQVRRFEAEGLRHRCSCQGMVRAYVFSPAIARCRRPGVVSAERLIFGYCCPILEV